MPENQHLSFYVYYAEPWESLLVGAVRPLVKKLIEQGLITQYFFIRYWERGPHIRLRLKKNMGVHDAQIAILVENDLRDFILKNPSELFLTPEMEERKLAASWRTNNQIFSISYQPETSRYGGINGLPLAELQFFASSRMVLNEFIETPEWSYDHALGAAIKLHIGFIFSTGLAKDKMVEFFEKNCRDWLPAAVEGTDEVRQQEQILSQFEKAYLQQKEALLPYIQGIWTELRHDPSGSSSPFWENWLSINQAVFTNLDLLEKSGLLNPSNSDNTDPTKPKYWNILSDFVHLTNNRLGVLNRDEGYLGYILAQALNDLKVR